ncbi:MAG: hypothetical protein ACLFSZ_05620 [Puniceicoccaceae bacterium]
MKLVRLIEALRTHPRRLRRAGLAVLVLLPLLDALPFVVDKTHVHTGMEKLPGFWSVFGLAACFALVLGSKLLGRAGLQRKEEARDE